MPTGFTYLLYEGEQSFEEFAWTCARGLTYCIHQRDQSLRHPPERRVVGTYYVSAVVSAVAKLKELLARSDDDWVKSRAEEEEERRKRNHESAKLRAQRASRYLKMLEHVEAWKPPTPDHECLRIFMRKQLEETLEFDCRNLPEEAPEVISLEKYKATQIFYARQDLERDRKSLNEEEERVKVANAWIDALYESLGGPYRKA